jgi:hypothetical protein
MQNQNSEKNLNNIIELQIKYDITLIPSLNKNDNSDTAKIIREHKNNIGFMNVQSHTEKKLDLSVIYPEIQTLYRYMLSDHDKWKEVEVESLKTILLQNELLLSNVEDLKRDLRERT